MQQLPTVQYPTVGGLLYIRVSSNCQHGSDIAITPADAFNIVKTARAADGKYAAVVLKPLRLVRARIVASQEGQRVGSLDVELKNF